MLQESRVRILHKWAFKRGLLAYFHMHGPDHFDVTTGRSQNHCYSNSLLYCSINFLKITWFATGP